MKSEGERCPPSDLAPRKISLEDRIERGNSDFLYGQKAGRVPAISEWVWPQSPRNVKSLVRSAQVNGRYFSDGGSLSRTQMRRSGSQWTAKSGLMPEPGGNGLSSSMPMYVTL